MLSLLPQLLNFSFTGIAILRLGLAIVIGAQAIYFLKRNRSARSFRVWLLGLIELVIAFLLLVGLWTQAAALLVALIALGSLVLNYHHRANEADGDTFHFVAFYLLLLVSSIALATLGAGKWAIDWPL